MKNIRRSAVKSLLSFGLALLFLGLIGQFSITRGIYRDAFESIEVKAFFMDALSLNKAVDISASQYVKASYYEEYVTNELECNSMPVTVIMTNDIERFSGGAAEIRYLEGYDSSSMREISIYSRSICVLESGLMKALGIQLGDTVRFNAQGLLERLRREYITDTNDESVRSQQEEIVSKIFDQDSAFYTVAGVMTSDNAPNNAYVTVSAGLDQTLSNNLVFDYVEYTLISPSEADEFSKFAESKVTASIGSIGAAGGSFVMDTSEADNMQRMIGLLDTLYPIAVTIAVLMGGLLPVLIVAQSEKVAAIMRILGTTKKRTRAVLILEQAVLCVSGLICAAALLWAINGSALTDDIREITVGAVLLLLSNIAGASTCAIIMTRRRILELLQVKE
jgi:hypothetical protein